MTRRIALFGGSFNPPGLHHRAIATHLSQHFDEVVIVPCGPRPDKIVTNDVEPVYRAAMVDMAFQGLESVRVELFDLEALTFTRTHELDRHFSAAGEVWHVVGTDLLQGGAGGDSLIHRVWEHGVDLWNDGRFAVIQRPGYAFDAGDLPPRNQVFEVEREGAGDPRNGDAIRGSSTEIRDCVLRNERYQDLVTGPVARYIERHGLYRGVNPHLSTRLPLADERYFLVYDENARQAVELAEVLPGVDPDDATMIIVIGGDGTMLRAIREHWRLRLPFYGINAGHIGFLLNQRSILDMTDEVALEQLPLLWVEMTGADGEIRSSLAFNDAWVERGTGQTAWLQVLVDGHERFSQLVADGALVATAAGSSSYARAMGAAPLPLNTPSLLLVGSNVLRPASWRPSVLPLSAQIELTTLDAEKRPLNGFIDGVPQGEVSSMKARVSNIAAVELAFDPEHNPAEKLARLQFPPLAD